MKKQSTTRMPSKAVWREYRRSRGFGDGPEPTLDTLLGAYFASWARGDHVQAERDAAKYRAKYHERVT